jgi:type IV pilus assembly protein PilA
MLQKNKTKRQEGFTIIEVLIVIAIAGLIILLVFLAVPALQRNSRNTQRKNDISAILAAMSEFSNNNNGQQPNGTWTNTGGTVTVIGAAGTSNATGRVAYYNIGLGTTNGNISKVAASTATAANTLNSNTEDYVIISTGTECNGNASQAGPARSVTAVYQIETGINAYSQVCQQS